MDNISRNSSRDPEVPQDSGGVVALPISVTPSPPLALDAARSTQAPLARVLWFVMSANSPATAVLIPLLVDKAVLRDPIRLDRLSKHQLHLLL